MKIVRGRMPSKSMGGKDPDKVEVFFGLERVDVGEVRGYRQSWVGVITSLT